ncbi:TPA: ParB-like nuclease domain-containing protein [Clostridium botulinum]|nr:ParB-like nuclease domain-containing protein [Clostridium botulinum]HCL4455215.1 ParB-like nuclease domain-containing protein [Clostridium botulinum]
MENKTMKLIEGATMIGVIQQTYDYSKFKLHPKNRQVRKDKINNIQKSMSYRDILNPIFVNQNLEIGDGQHRFLARKELGLPIIFIVIEGLDVEAMQILNDSNTKSQWTHEDYLNMHIDEGKEDYITFNNLINTYKINFSDLLQIICELSNNDLGEREIIKNFDKGNLQILECLDRVVEFLNELTLFDKYEYCRHTSFVRSFLKLYIKDFYNKDYMKKRIDICDNKLEQFKGTTIFQFGEFLSKKIYTNISRGISIVYNEPLNDYFPLDLGQKGRKKRKTA